jgi:hypothetical protein
LIAQAFQSVRYPILPILARNESGHRDILATRPTSFYTPADFDISPFFAVIKPMVEVGFDCGKIDWAEAPTCGRRWHVRPCRSRRSPRAFAARVGICRASARSYRAMDERRAIKTPLRP